MEKPQTLQQVIKHFSDEKVCIDAVAKMRWPDGAECPACGTKKPYWLETQKRWKCRECRRQFSVKLGTIFEDSPIALQKWLPALWMLINCRNGVSSYEIARALGVSQKSAWFMLHRLRLVLRNKGLSTIMGGPGQEVEVDETFIGGKARNMHKSKRVRTKVKGTNWAKTVVMGMLHRGGDVDCVIIPTREAHILKGVVRETVLKGSHVMTDEHVGYYGLADEQYEHKIVNHLERYVDGRVHTNGLENFWSLLKRGLNGTYVAVEPFHLARYVDEQVFRFNNRKDDNGRKITDAERFDKALSQVAGKRLTFAEVTGKTEQTTTPF